MTFTHTVIADVSASYKTMRTDDTQSHRRDYIRAVFSAIEGLNWRIKQNILNHAKTHADISIHEHAAMLEETYSIDDQGNVTAVPRFLPLTSTIRLTVKMLQRYQPGYTIDFGHVGWSGLKTSIGVRNRLVHPKTEQDLIVSEREIDAAHRAFGWMLAWNIEALEVTKDFLEQKLGKPD